MRLISTPPLFPDDNESEPYQFERLDRSVPPGPEAAAGLVGAKSMEVQERTIAVRDVGFL